MIVDLSYEQEDVEEELKVGDEIRDILSVYPYVKGDGFEDEETYTIDFVKNQERHNDIME